MSSDTSTKAPSPAWRHAGIGHSSTFLCARCRKGRTMLGRKIQTVRGMRDWVCADCSQKAKP